MKAYLNILEHVMRNGYTRDTRSGSVISTFNNTFTHDMSDGFPILTTKRMNMDAITAELLLFLNGSCDRRLMQEYQHGEFQPKRWDIWKGDCERSASNNPNAFNGYNLGEMYPEQWRKLWAPSANTLVALKPKKVDTKDIWAGAGDYTPQLGHHKLEPAIVHSPMYYLWRSLNIAQNAYIPWHDFSVFYDDVFTLPNFQSWVDDPDGWKLDCSYYGSNLHAKDISIFIPVDMEFDKSHDTGTEILRPRLFIDQLSDLISLIQTDPHSRYLLVDNWNPSHKGRAVLGACHTSFVCYVRDNHIDLHWNQRSVDSFLGLGYNIASYGLLLCIICKITGYTPGKLSAGLMDTHIYKNHLLQVVQQLDNEPKTLPTMRLPDIKSLDDLSKYKSSDFVLEGYKSHDAIPAPLSVG